MFSLKFLSLLIASAIIGSRAETHTVHFDNRCGFGTPTLIQGSNVVSTGGDFTSNGPITSAIAYLQTGGCGFNGEGCTTIEANLTNPTSPVGSGSNTCIVSCSVSSGFSYFNGCDGAGADCPDLNCVACEANNVNLAITFCD
ncbi:glycopeptide [Flammula alnicola]|nr:glycopeptide [Flammula alnicola]